MAGSLGNFITDAAGYANALGQALTGTSGNAIQSIRDQREREEEQAAQQAATLAQFGAQGPVQFDAPTAATNPVLTNTQRNVEAQQIGGAQLGLPGQETALSGLQLGQDFTGLGQLLAAQARGEGGPSAAELQLQQGTERAIKAAQAQAASQLGLSPAQQALMAQETGAELTQQAAQNAAILRAQEQQAAQQLASGTLGQIEQAGLGQRALELEAGTTQAQLQQQTEQFNATMAQEAEVQSNIFQQAAEQFNISTTQAAEIANMNAQLTAAGIDRDTALGMMANQLGVDRNNLDALFRAQEQELAQSQQRLNEARFGLDLAGAAFQAGGNVVGGILQTFMSDRNLKTNIKKGDSAVDKFLKSLKGYEYEYKDPEKDGAGVYVSPMAQDLEKTTAGRGAVVDTPRGKMVDYGRLLGPLLASVGRLNERLEKVGG